MVFATLHRTKRYKDIYLGLAGNRDVENLVAFIAERKQRLEELRAVLVCVFPMVDGAAAVKEHIKAPDLPGEDVLWIQKAVHGH